MRRQPPPAKRPAPLGGKRRRALSELLSQEPAAQQGPEFLRALPRQVLALVLRPPARLRQSAKALIDLRLACDLPALTNAQRQVLNLPGAARSLLVAREQERALAAIHLFVKTELTGEGVLSGLCDQHADLRVMGFAVLEYLAGVELALTIVKAARALALQRLEAWVSRQLAREPPDSPQLDRLEAMKRSIDDLRRTRKAKADAWRQKAAAQRRLAMQQIADAEADLLLARTMLQLRQGLVPDQESLLAAARRYKEVQAQAAQQAEIAERERPATRPHASPGVLA